MNRGRMLVLGCCLLLLPGLLAAKPVKFSRLLKGAESVELFSAIKAGTLDVKLIPKDATRSTVIVKNLSGKPLRIEMPAAFAGLPVLAQDDFGDAGGGRGGGLGGNQNQQQGQQALGGGMGGMGGGMMGGMGGMGGMMGGGMFNVAPDRVHKFQVQTVCLQHGKKDPNPRVAYELHPISAFTSDANVQELCSMLGRHEIDQVSAQAAAWHLTDNLDWQQLASKVKTKHLNGTVDMYFSPLTMQRAMNIVQLAKRRAAQQSEKQASPGEKDTDETL